MAVKRIQGAGIWYPAMQSLDPGYFAESDFSVNLSKIILDGTVTKVFFPMRCHRSLTLDSFELWLGDISGGFSSTLKFSFQDMDSNGLPDGTPDQYVIESVFAADAWHNTAVMTDDGTETGNKREVVRGDWVCCVVEYDTYTPGDSISVCSFSQGVITKNSMIGEYSGSWSQHFNYIPFCALHYSRVVEYTNPNYPQEAVNYYDTPLAQSNFPADTILVSSLTSTTTPDEIGCRTALDFNASIDAVAVLAKLNAGATAILSLYDNNYNVIASVNLGSSDPQGVWAYHVLFLPTAWRIVDNEWFYVALRATNATAVDVPVVSFDGDYQYIEEWSGWTSNGLMQTQQGNGRYQKASRADEVTSWDLDDTKRPFISYHICALSDDRSAGGWDGEEVNIYKP